MPEDITRRMKSHGLFGFPELPCPEPQLPLYTHTHTHTHTHSTALTTTATTIRPVSIWSSLQCMFNVSLPIQNESSRRGGRRVSIPLCPQTQHRKGPKAPVIYIPDVSQKLSSRASKYALLQPPLSYLKPKAALQSIYSCSTI